MSAEKGIEVLPPDLDVIKTILESAEIDYDEVDYTDETILYFNGVMATFDSSSQLITIEAS